MRTHQEYLSVDEMSYVCSPSRRRCQHSSNRFGKIHSGIPRPGSESFVGRNCHSLRWGLTCQAAWGMSHSQALASRPTNMGDCSSLPSAGQMSSCCTCASDNSLCFPPCLWRLLTCSRFRSWLGGDWGCPYQHQVGRHWSGFWSATSATDPSLNSYCLVV